MRAQHKVGNQAGRPAYRTPASFRVRKSIGVQQLQSRNRNTSHTRGK